MIGSRHGGRTYKVNIDDLLGHLKKNREEHVEIVNEAQENFRAEFIKRVDAMLKDAQNNQPISVKIGLTVPTIHTDAFDNAIGLLEMTQRAGETTIEITSDEYERFVRNNWEWSRDFAVTNSRYSKKI